MQTSTTLRRFSPTAILFALGITLAVAVGFVIAVQNFTPSSSRPSTTNAAEQDLRIVMQELERERLDQSNASTYIEALHTRNAAAQDKRMVMQELEREQFPQVFAKSYDAAFSTCNVLRSSCDR